MITLDNVYKEFDGKWISNGVSLAIPPNSSTCIIGRSGEGKSVLFKQIIGLIKPTRGKIYVDGIDVTTLDHESHELLFKTCGYVFQTAALLDSLTVFENIGLPLVEQGKSYEEILPVVHEKIALVHLDVSILDKYPAELSGGMRKRVGLARTLITNPKVILFDEPTTGLDPVTSRIVHELIREMQQRLKLTVVIISHDTEIFQYVDYVALLHNGKICYFGKADTIWKTHHPHLYQFIRGLSHEADQPEAFPCK